MRYNTGDEEVDAQGGAMTTPILSKWVHLLTYQEALMIRDELDIGISMLETLQRGAKR